MRKENTQKFEEEK